MIYFKKINRCLTKEVNKVKELMKGFFRAILIAFIRSALPSRREVEVADGVRDGVEAYFQQSA